MHETEGPSQHYDVIVIGAGQSGGPLSSAFQNAGKKTVLVESTHIGGVCVNEGCTPTKTMIASGRVAYLARRGADFGVETGPVSIDMKKIRERKRKIVDEFRSGSESAVHDTKGLDYLNGHAAFSGPHDVTVTLHDGSTRKISAPTIVINVGEHPAGLPIEGADAVTVLNSTTVMELDVVPEHLLILGGGYIALEFGQLFRRLGAAVTIVERGHQLMEREDADVASAVKDIVEQDGVTVLLETTGARLAPDGDGVAFTVKGPDGEKTLRGSHLLAAAGRAPNTKTLGLESAGVKTNEHGYIAVDDKLRTNVEGVYAVGDVKGGPAFTHISFDDYRILKTNLIEGGDASIAGRLVPYTMFIDPQLGRVGISESEARKAGRTFRVAKMPMSRVARAEETDETRGFMKIIVDGESDQILGAAVLGIEGGEIMSMIEIAMMGKLPYTALRDGVFAHPLLSEALNNVFSSLADG